MADRDENFSTEDLALLNDEGASEPDQGKETPSQAREDRSGDAEAEKGGKDGTPAKRLSETLVDDIDEEDEVPAPKDEDKEGKEEPKSEPAKTADNPKWREDFAEKLLGNLKDRLTAAQLERRRSAIMNDLKRYKSEFDYMVAGTAAREKIRSGEYRAKPPADASEEEIAAWREENGIPVKAKDYEIPKIAGYKWTDNDKPLIENFKTFAHKANYTQDQVNVGAEWYVKMVQETQEKYWEDTQRSDAQSRQIAMDQLRGEYGPDLKPSLEITKRLLDDDQVMPNNLGHKLKNARYLDDNNKWQRLLNDVAMSRMLINYAQDTYGRDGSFITGDAKANAKNEKAELEKLMNTDYEEFMRSGGSEKLLALSEQEEKSVGRRRAA